MLEKYKDLMESCAICHDQCVSACPIFTVERKTTVYPSRKAQIARCIMLGEVDLDEDAAELYYQCCGCRQCMSNCVHLKDQKDPVQIFRDVRYEAVKKGIKPDFVKRAEDTFKAAGNLYGDISGNLKKLQEVNASGKGLKILYITDAETLALNPEAPIAAVKLMNKRNIDVRISEMTETGLDIRSAGFGDAAKEIAAKTAEYINTQDVNNVVVSNPKAYYALTSWYEELGLKLNKKIELEVSFLYDILIVEQKDVGKRPEDVLHFIKMDKTGTYQDGSYMARYLKEFDKPRTMIRPLFNRFLEMNFCRELAKPVAPADYPLGISESTLKGMANWRIADLEDVKADCVVTSDPLTNAAFKKYWAAEKVLSIPEVLLMNYVEKVI